MAPYCEPTDLLLGNIPLPAFADQSKFVQDAADEIDSKIGFVYKTPVVLANTDANRPALLLLKRLNAHLASGRLIMALDAGGQDDRLHAYGYNLVKEATLALEAIARREIVLDGAPPIHDGADNTVPPIVVNNIDPESQVEAFYDRVAAPTYGYGYRGLGESYLR